MHSPGHTDGSGEVVAALAAIAEVFGGVFGRRAVSLTMADRLYTALPVVGEVVRLDAVEADILIGFVEGAVQHF